MPTFDNSRQIIDPVKFNKVVRKLRDFFLGKDFIEVHTQNRLSILAACEDPTTIATYEYNNQKWPLPQTGQMWLEYEMLKNPTAEGFFCVSTSYRNEPNPIEGRHDLIFPMFEFELKGGLDELIKLEKELLEYLGYRKNLDTVDYMEGQYMDLVEQYKSFNLTHQHEQQMYKDYGSVYLLKNFPTYTSPFWNMALYDDTRYAKKVDVILSGMETIGSAERSNDPVQMKESFNTISDGMYSKALYGQFGKDRVEKELDEFLKLDFFTRSGGGIGITRLISSMEKEHIL